MTGVSMDYIHWINTDPSYFCAWIRCILLFCLSVLLFRFTNHRFNITTPLDFLIIAIAGGLISRGIAGANSLGITVEALFTLIILHFILSKLCFGSTVIPGVCSNLAHAKSFISIEIQ